MTEFWIAAEAERELYCDHKHRGIFTALGCARREERKARRAGRKTEIWTVYKVTEDSLVHGVGLLQRDRELLSMGASVTQEHYEWEEVTLVVMPTEQ